MQLLALDLRKDDIVFSRSKNTMQLIALELNERDILTALRYTLSVEARFVEFRKKHYDIFDRELNDSGFSRSTKLIQHAVIYISELFLRQVYGSELVEPDFKKNLANIGAAERDLERYEQYLVECKRRARGRKRTESLV